jgi:hypothetical protein
VPRPLGGAAEASGSLNYFLCNFLYVVHMVPLDGCLVGLAFDL